MLEFLFKHSRIYYFNMNKTVLTEGTDSFCFCFVLFCFVDNILRTVEVNTGEVCMCSSSLRSFVDYLNQGA